MGSRSPSLPAHSHVPANDRFVVERCLGEGSMGAVFKAFDRERGEHVALKTLRRVDPSGIYRFKQEFRALADVSHPSLVQLHELFSESSEWFFSMELVEGQDFLSYVLGSARPRADSSHRSTRELRGAAQGDGQLAATPLRNPDALRALLRQVVQAVMALHAVGKLHRDLKPDNVMVTGEGRAVVLDFGITAERTRDSRGTLEGGGVMGTPAYMSPEQAAGTEVDEATDWYALGAMLYEALTGEVPFDGSYTEVLQHKQQSDPPPPSSLVSGVPPALDALCMRLLARDPRQRPSGSKILDALGGGSRTTSDSIAPPFMGRSTELAELERALAATDEGAPVVVFLHGMTGMGKTALCEQFVQRAQAGGAVTLCGRCYEHEVVPFKALDSLVDALSRYLGRLSSHEAAEVLPKDIHALCQLFPVLERVDVVRMAKRRGRLASDPGTLRRQATHALKELFARVAMRQPLVVQIDDLQWGDVDSARILAELASGLERPALLFVFTYRTADKERSPCVAKLRELLHDRLRVQVREVILRELREPESVELASRLLDASHKGDAPDVARESRGSPYLLTQLIDHLHAERRSSPEIESGIRVSLERALSERLAGLSSHARRVLELVAVSGRPLRERAVAELVPDVALNEALAELRRGKLVRGVGTADARAIGMYHDSLRETVLGSMNREQVRQWHRQLARATERGEQLDQEALIDHLLGAEEHGRAALYAIGAARAAMAALAFDKAAELYEIAVRHHEDGDWRRELTVELAGALVSAGRSSRAAEVYLQAAAVAAPDEASALALKAGTQFFASGHLERAAEVLRPPLRELGIELPNGAQDALTQAFDLWPVLRARGYEFTPRSEVELAPQTRARLDALWSLVQTTLGTDPELCQVFALRFLLEALDAGERRRIVTGLCANFITVDLAYSSVGGFKPRSLQRAEELCAGIDDPRCQGWLAFARAFAFENQGLLKPASLDYALAEELFRTRCRDVAPELNACRMLFAHVLGMLGQLDDLGLCEQWTREALDREDAVVAARMRLLLLPRLLASGEVARAQEHAVVPRELLGERPGLTALLHFNGRAFVALYQHDREALAGVTADVDAAMRSPLLVVRIWRSDHMIVRARLLLAASRAAEQPEPLLVKVESSIETIGEIGLECHVDHARILSAAVAARRGDKALAVELLDSILADGDMVGDSRILLACARLRRGQLVGGELGAALVRQGERALAAHGVKDPMRFARVYAPGFDDAGE
jgi:eukaryotic-like serine/threonine-protein kinase